MILRSVLAVMLSMHLAAAAEPRLDKTNLFTAGEGGYRLYRIPGILLTPKGSLLAYCEARHAPRWVAGHDWARMDILVRRSTDGGDTWSTPYKLVEPPGDVVLNPVAVEKQLCKPGDITLHNAVGIADHETGRVHFLCGVEYNRCYHLYSDDDGLTFSEPVEITETFEAFRPRFDWRVIACGPGHGLQLRTGRFVVPVWLSTGAESNGHEPNVAASIYSDDHGATWQAGDIALAPPGGCNANETTAVELANGRVMFNVRNDVPHGRSKFYRAVLTSPDGATSWTEPRYDTALPEPICMGSLARVTTPERDVLLFCNPDNARSLERKNVTVRLSDDRGETWPVSRVLEPGRSGYSDMAVGPDGTIYCFYERGTFTERHLDTRHLCVARFSLAWVEAGASAE